MISLMAHPKTTPQKQPLVVRSHTLTQEADTILKQLNQGASDALGWTVGSSAIIRALLRYTNQQTPAWVSESLHPLIEQEIASGTVWGTKKK
jgi:hypothetical protein